MSNKIQYPMQKLRELYQHFSDVHILVVGDLILDHYIWGKVERISPEAPVPVLSVQRRESRIGGAGNTAANLASLGAKVTVAGICGDDPEAATLRTLLGQEGIRTLIATDNSRSTTSKSRVIAQRQQLLRIDEENTETIKPDIKHELHQKILANAVDYQGVILSDYAKGVLSPGLLAQIVALFPSIPVIIDPKGYNYSKYAGATALKPNFKEFRAAVKHPELQKDEIELYARKLVGQLSLKGMLVTLGEDGVFVLDDRAQSHIIPTKAKEVFDVSGAGDTFTAAFTAALVLSGDWFLSARAANLASGVAVAKIGTATVTVEEIFNNYK